MIGLGNINIPPSTSNLNTQYIQPATISNLTTNSQNLQNTQTIVNPQVNQNILNSNVSRVNTTFNTINNNTSGYLSPASTIQPSNITNQTTMTQTTTTYNYSMPNIYPIQPTQNTQQSNQINQQQTI